MKKTLAETRKISYLIIYIALSALLAFSLGIYRAKGADEKRAVFLRDGGTGDGSTYSEALGDFKEAVRLLSDGGGTIVICGRYTYDELIVLSEKSGTANGDAAITVTSVYGGEDYRVKDGASLRAGTSDGSANMILAGDFVFENLDIVAAGSDKARAIICGGNDVTFGEGITCRKTGNAPYISIVGGSVGEKCVMSGFLTIKSGTYNYVCAGSRDGGHEGDTHLTIDGGTFEGIVSATGIDEDATGISAGKAAFIANGGVFSGGAGAFSSTDEKFEMIINGGTFRGNVVCNGRINTLDINGGSLESVNAVKVADAPLPQPDETDGDKTPERSEVNINEYSGDVQALAAKISGEGVAININSSGGVVFETEGATPSTSPDDVPSSASGETSSDEPNEETESGGEQNATRLFESDRNKAIAIAVLCSAAAVSAVALTYRVVRRRR